MNPRTLPSRLANRLVPALLLAAAVWALPCATAEAGCGSHDGRPTVPLGWMEAGTSTDRPVPSDRTPACSGPSCSRRPAPTPILPAPRSLPHPDVWVEDRATPLPVKGPDDVATGRQELSPIGRITDIERPPCHPAS